MAYIDVRRISVGEWDRLDTRLEVGARAISVLISGEDTSLPEIDIYFLVPDGEAQRATAMRRFCVAKTGKPIYIGEGESVSPVGSVVHPEFGVLHIVEINLGRRERQALPAATFETLRKEANDADRPQNRS